ncbi:hypothetical protein N9164_09855 [Draconibacterium sp.]|nr:hypothetical protein [Draconibacterium sp.]
MNDFEEILKNIVLAPYISKATALIGIKRDIGGNAFRHQMGVMSILIDYKCVDSIVLKGSTIHDLLEDIPSTNIKDLRGIDSEANQVVDLVLEITKTKKESKTAYLRRLLESGSEKAKLLKVADRIDNITELTSDIYSIEKIEAYLEQTRTYILPMAKQVSTNMFRELSDLIERRQSLCH